MNLRPLLFLCTLAAMLPAAMAAFPPVALKPVVLHQLHSPVAITAAGDGSGRLFLCEQRGQIRVVQHDMLLPAVFLDLSAKLVTERPGSDERGLLGLAFHPGYATPASPGYRRFYVYYCAPPAAFRPPEDPDPADCAIVLAEYKVSTGDPSAADPASERILLRFEKPQDNHNGGQLAFGPDGYLYIGTGDGGGENDNRAGHTGGSGSTNPGPAGVMGNAQDNAKLMGKILRLDPLGTNGSGGQYGIPADNPFAGAGGGVRHEIYALGFRDPAQFSFDTGSGGNGILLAADRGQDSVEEVNVISAGGNYGWRAREGTFDFDASAPHGGLPFMAPIAEYAHTGTVVGAPPRPQIGGAVTGGCIYRGSAIAGLSGKYIFADKGSESSAAGTLLGLEESAPGVWSLTVLDVAGGNPLSLMIAAFGRDESGELYVATRTAPGAPSRLDPVSGLLAGGLYKLVPGSSATGAAQALISVRDNSLYSNNGGQSSGVGENFFAGMTGTELPGALRRALVKFEPAGSIPRGARITGGTVQLTVTKSNSPANLFTLHRVLNDWGEGTSNAGLPGGQGAPAMPSDATWTHRFFDSITWDTPGGDFVSAVSAETMVDDDGPYLWTGSGLRPDIQGWLDNPAVNFGWLVRGTETGDAATARRFASRENDEGDYRPLLTVNYVHVPPATHRESWLRQYFTIGEYVDDFADPDQDGIANQLEYGFAYSPLAASAPGLTARLLTIGGVTQFRLTFRRDPRATDLTYRLQVSTDLAAWTTIAESAGGAMTAGSGFLADNEIATEAPVRRVNAQIPAAARHFARLLIVRQP